MKKIKLIIASSLVLASSFVFANPTHITDQFLGEANVGLNQDQDVFGGNAYEIDSFDVNIDFDTGYLTVDVNTFYQDGSAGTNSGDLFISTNGWNPHSVPGDCNLSGQCYNQDNSTNGEDWEYGVVTTTGALMSGFNVILASSSYPVGNARGNQEVLVDTGTGTNAGTSIITDNLNGTATGYIRYAILLSDLGLAATDTFELGLRWAMTCGNDIIEGGVAYDGSGGMDMPEPSILALIGLGLVFPVMNRRKKLKIITD